MYEITITELTPYTAEEEAVTGDRSYRDYPSHPGPFSDRKYHQVRTTYAMLTPEQFEAVKKAIIGGL